MGLQFLEMVQFRMFLNTEIISVLAEKFFHKKDKMNRKVSMFSIFELFCSFVL